jgi:hypothetical protein
MREKEREERRREMDIGTRKIQKDDGNGERGEKERRRKRKQR